MQLVQAFLLLVAPAAVLAHLPYYLPYNYGHPIRPSGTTPYYPTGTGTAPYYPTGTGTAPYYPTGTGTAPYYPTGTGTGTGTGIGYVYPTAALQRVARRAEMMAGAWA